MRLVITVSLLFYWSSPAPSLQPAHQQAGLLTLGFVCRGGIGPEAIGHDVDSWRHTGRKASNIVVRPSRSDMGVCSPIVVWLGRLTPTNTTMIVAETAADS
jgi:hypothetical protein